MKKYLLFFLAALLLLTACTAADPQPDSGDFLFYYPALSPSGALGTFCTQATTPEDNLEGLLRTYLEAPVPEGGTAVLPGGWTLKAVRQENDTVLLELTGKRATPVQQSLACACLAQTLLQLPELQRVSFTLPGSSTPLVLTSNDIFLEDTGMLPQEEAVTLYFPDSQQRYLVKETVLVEAAEAEDKPACIMEQLLSGSSGGQLNSCIPKGTKLLNISVENGICTVNLSAHFINNMEPRFSAECMAVYSIVNSLTELPEVTTVDILAAGAPIEKLHRMDLSSGLTRDEGLIYDASENAVDVTLYPLCGEDGFLVPVPALVVQEPEQSAAEATLLALLNYEGKPGMVSCIPAGTKLLSLRTENGSCVVDLTGEFLGGCATAEEETLAVRAVISTLCALPGIKTVEIVVEGLEPAYQSTALHLIRQSNPVWLAE